MPDEKLLKGLRVHAWSTCPAGTVVAYHRTLRGVPSHQPALARDCDPSSRSTGAPAVTGVARAQVLFGATGCGAA
ncbi:MAG: hypothetical protein U0325_23470 [Polyangiales bacterium]